MSTKTPLTGNNAIERPSQAKHPRVYQIDFTAVASGKRIASTKRRVRWRFGFANPEALANGQTGTACRGEEHDITLVWSITSGKRLILADGQEVHYSSTRGNKLDFSWTMRGNHVLKIVAHASPPLSASPGFRQYDFYVDGQSFFVFPKVFRLGLAPAASAPRGSSGGYNNYSLNGTGSSKSARQTKSGVAAVETPNTYDEEQAYLQEAIKNSLQETGPSLNFSNNNVSTEGQNLLMDFMDDNTTQISAPGQAGAASALPPSTFPPPTSYGATLQQQPYGAQTSYPPIANYNSAIVPSPHPGILTPAGIQKADPWGNHPSPPVYNTAAPHSTPVDPWTAQPNVTVTSSNYHQSSAIPQVAPLITDPWGAQNAAPPVSNPVSDQWGLQNTLPGTTSAASDSWEAKAAAMPHAYGIGQASSSVPETPAAVVDMANPAPPTPSSIGFASPQGQSQNFVATIGYQLPNQQPGFTAETVAAQNFAPLPNSNETQQEEPETFVATEQKFEASTADPALFTMSGLSGQVNTAVETDPNASLADQAYAKYANMGEFDLITRSTIVKDNPFETKSPNESVSLQDMKKTVKSEPKKNIMNDPSNPMSGALVVAPAQTGNNWGQQTGLGSYGQQPPYGQQPLGYGQQPQSTLGQQMQQPSYGQQQQPPPAAYGQQPPSYGQTPPLQQQPHNLRQNYGQNYTQQPPPLQQNPYESFAQQQY